MKKCIFLLVSFFLLLTAGFKLHAVSMRSYRIVTENDTIINSRGDTGDSGSFPIDPNPPLIIWQNSPIFINRYSEIGIGKISSGYALEINGALRARKILINLAGNAGADFVFDPVYKLRKLDEVEKFIRSHRHLPDIPSADEMRQRDMDISDFHIKLLQKIEELTLHLIGQSEKLEVIDRDLKGVKRP